VRATTDELPPRDGRAAACQALLRAYRPPLQRPARHCPPRRTARRALSWPRAPGTAPTVRSSRMIRSTRPAANAALSSRGRTPDEGPLSLPARRVWPRASGPCGVPWPY